MYGVTWIQTVCCNNVFIRIESIKYVAIIMANYSVVYSFKDL